MLLLPASMSNISNCLRSPRRPHFFSCRQCAMPAAEGGLMDPAETCAASGAGGPARLSRVVSFLSPLPSPSA